MPNNSKIPEKGTESEPILPVVESLIPKQEETEKALKAIQFFEKVPVEPIVPTTVGSAFDLVSAVLKTMSNQQASEVIKLLGASHNFRVVSQFAPTGNNLRSAHPRETRGERGPRGQPKADPKVKDLRSKISALNSEISEKSRKVGHNLNEDDELLVKRGQLFRDLKEAQNKLTSSK